MRSVMRGKAKANRRDPAPSRLAYRMNRLMLTPMFRRFLRYGLPVLVLAAGALWWASDEGRRQDAIDRVAEIKRQIEERPEFMVRMMAVERASDGVEADIRETLPLDFPVSSFDLDLDELRERVEEIDAVAAASVRIRQGGVLEVDVVERVPVAIWRTAETLALLDPGGHRVAPLEARDLRPDLPLIAGKGADREVAEALAILAVAEPIAGRMRGLVRVGERRWDVVLDREQRILLPETKPVTALEKVIALDQAQDLLARDIANVDFRNPKRPVLRLTPSAIETLYDTYLTSSEGQTE
ncbi:MAG: FtsQ-type POTRA domain-containing protein [Boseongicola sp.]|nr:FtsQ-type POTRA domain-containing protein [Silicimonas sp.]NNF91877.1 FtsQ-type POTRA domain-containing protein [Boseongicola sp.]RZW05508.1 MAG: FtsQ-type POTRA domain-containing protein [Paracoccaceae bacterium]NND42071.1 FtsQ-type POTRA domain-containing protein [Silicimonas sp.]NNL35414.1 FtsQ-type POTRA domain-containing protein [Silicimonas sp.]